MNNTEWIYCPICGNKTRTMIRKDTELKELTADSGYCSEKNLLFLKEHNIESYIKLQDHEQRKSRAYKENIGKLQV